MREVWYRYFEYWTTPIDEYDEPMPGQSTLHISLEKFPVVRHTPKGVQLDIGYGTRDDNGKLLLRFVLKDARKQFACPTKLEAMKSFLARKKRQLSIYEARASSARIAINNANQMLTQLETDEQREKITVDNCQPKCDNHPRSNLAAT